MDTSKTDRLIGEKIATKRCNDSLRTVAQAAGMPFERLRRIEMGTEHATEGDLRTIACALGTSPESLLPPNVSLSDYR